MRTAVTPRMIFSSKPAGILVLAAALDISDCSAGGNDDNGPATVAEAAH